MAGNNTTNAAHQNVQNLGAGGFYGPYASPGGGGVPVARSDIDQRRMAIGRVPMAEYPDGYLATIRSRRDDRGRPSSASDVVLDSLKNRTAQRSYQRGVHKGERVDPADYYWPDELRPMRGLENEARGIKTRPLLQFGAPTHLVNDGKADHRGTEPAQFDLHRSQQFARMRPAWR